MLRATAEQTIAPYGSHSGDTFGVERSLGSLAIQTTMRSSLATLRLSHDLVLLRRRAPTWADLPSQHRDAHLHCIWVTFSETGHVSQIQVQ